MIDGSLWARSVAIPLHWEASKDEQLLPRGGANKAKINAELFFLLERKKPKKANSCTEKKKESKKERNSIHRYRRPVSFLVVTVQNYIVRLILKTRK